VTGSRAADLLTAGSGLTAAELHLDLLDRDDEAVAAALASALGSADVTVADAVTDADLTRLARAAARVRPGFGDIVAVDSGPFGARYCDALGITAQVSRPPVLVVVGSPAETTRRQLAAARQVTGARIEVAAEGLSPEQVAALATAAASPYLPSVSAVTPQLVADADLPGANAARSAVTGASIVAGPALGGILLLLGSPALAFLLNAATFGLAALATVAIPRAAFRTAGHGQRPTGLLRGVADGAAVLRSQPQALRLVGADIMCSLVYGMQTVLLVTVSQRLGLGMHGYGYLFAAVGAGGLAGTALASRALRCPHPRAILITALAAVGLPMPLLAVVPWRPLALVLVGLTGTGAIMVEIMTETGLQRMLDGEVFGRAYGLALPASLGGIVAGSLIAPVLIGAFGATGALVAAGAAVAGYVLLALARAPRRASALATPARDSGLDQPVLAGTDA